MFENSPAFQAHLKKISIYWANFYDKLEELMGRDVLEKLAEENPNYRIMTAKLNRLKCETVKRHISSTHTWIPGKQHYSKETENWHESPFECKVCKIGASAHDEVGYAGELEETTTIPSRDTHGQLMNRTCAEVVAARTAYRKSRKGRKCGQCMTYGCLMADE